MRTSLKNLRIVFSFISVSMVVKSCVFLFLYKKVEYFVARDLIHPTYLEIEKLFTHVNYEGETEMETSFIDVECLILIGSIFLLIFQYKVLTKAIKKDTFLNDLLPFTRKWLDHVNLGVKRLIGFLSNTVFLAVFCAALWYTLYLFVIFIQGGCDLSTYEEINGAFFGSMAGMILLYGTIWFLFSLLTWLYFGFTDKKVKAES